MNKNNQNVKKITIGDLTNLYKEEFYGIELHDHLTGEILEPLEYELETNWLIVQGFRVECDDENGAKIVVVAVERKDYDKQRQSIELTKDKE